MVVSDGLRSTLIWSKFKNFPRGACPQTLLERCALYVRKEKIPRCARCMAAPTPLNVCLPPLLKPLDLPLLCWREVLMKVLAI